VATRVLGPSAMSTAVPEEYLARISAEANAAATTESHVRETRSSRTVELFGPDQHDDRASGDCGAQDRAVALKRPSSPQSNTFVGGVGVGAELIRKVIVTCLWPSVRNMSCSIIRAFA